MKECLSCGFYEMDYGCTCKSSNKWYACPVESKKEENKKKLDEYCKWSDSRRLVETNNYCPYCEVKEDAKIKTVYSALKKGVGTCLGCGANLDAGQQTVKVKGYTEMYSGAIRLMDVMVERFRGILEYCDIDLNDYFDGEDVEIGISASEIIEKLFLGYTGGTTIGNFKNAIGVDESEHFWIISKGTE